MPVQPFRPLVADHLPDVRRIGILPGAVDLGQPALRDLRERPEDGDPGGRVRPHPDRQECRVFEHHVVGDRGHRGDAGVARDVPEGDLDAGGRELREEVGGEPAGDPLDLGAGLFGHLHKRPGVTLDHLHQGVEGRLFEGVP